MVKIKELVKKIKELDSDYLLVKGKPFSDSLRKEASRLRRELALLMESDYLFINGWYLMRQHHDWGMTVAFYDKDSWNRREEYLREKNPLDWIT